MVTLRGLDDRLVPRLALRLRLLLEAASVGKGQLSAAARRARMSVAGPAATASLRRLDDRLAGSGPLALVRNRPQLGLAVAAAVFVAGSGVVLAHSAGAPGSQPARAHDATLLPTSLGPSPGTSIAVYLQDTRRRMVALSQASPDGQFLALVSFDRYLTPRQASQLLGGLLVRRVLAHAPVRGAEVLPIPVTTTLVSDVTLSFTANAQRRLRDQREFLALAAAIGAKTPEQRTYRTFYRNAAHTAGLEAADYGGAGRCVFAALVRGRARDLAALPALRGVRAVDLGNGADDTLQLQPLLPEQQVTVTAPTATPASTGTGS